MAQSFNGQVVRVQDLISLQVQIDFEEAEILGNESCFANNWDFYKQVPWIPTKLSLGEGPPSVDHEESDCNLRLGCQLIVLREGAHALKLSTHLVKRAHALMST